MTVPLEHAERARAILRDEPGISSRQLAAAAGLSRATALSIIKRTWRPKMGRRPFRALLDTTRPPQRCPSCGGMVYLPCWLCKIRSLSEETPAK